MLIAAIVGRLGRAMIGMTIGVFVLVFLQPLFAAPDLDPRWLRSLHVLNALFIAALGFDLVRRGLIRPSKPWRRRRTGVVHPSTRRTDHAPACLGASSSRRGRPTGADREDA